MVQLWFLPLTSLDLVLIIIIDAIGFLSIAISLTLARRGYRKWIPRKVTHIAVSSLIALSLPFFSSLTAPAIALGVFLVVLFGCSFLGLDLKGLVLSAGTRRGESKLGTFLVAFFSLVVFATVFLIFIDLPFIFVSSILAVSWGDGAGEVVGRPLGRNKFSVWGGKTKSVEGSLAVMAMTFVAVMVAFFLFPIPVSLQSLLLAGATVSLVVAVVEVLCLSWTDNVVIPLLSALVLWYLLFVLF
jgi:dolichol kinase